MKHRIIKSIAIVLAWLLPQGVIAGPDTPENQLITLRNKMENAKTIKQQKG